MGKTKRIRDPLYGYINIEPDFDALVDTAEFQRLRNIVQTGYQALYPSALHNRFVHSLGVYHLGCKAIDFFWANISKDIPAQTLPETLTADWTRLRRTFLAACLLHDVGHSPFSHTGEQFYTKGIDFANELPEAVKAFYKKEDSAKDSICIQLHKDIQAKPKGTGKPHEAMSALAGLTLCGNLDIDPDLFVRAIIGAPYDCGGGSLETVVRNAVIGLLNGQLIDVDKLDYTERDAYVTGYSSLTLDVDRLLSGYTVGRWSKETWGVVYKKGALSVIENVIYANDLERRWIQNHPAILYDCALIDSLLRRFDAHMRSAKCSDTQRFVTVFTRQAISPEGMPGLKRPLKLLCDDDIVAYIKNEDDSEIAAQFFAREKRLKPLWKTEADFEALAGKNLTPDIQGLLTKDLDGMREYIRSHGFLFIDKDLLKTLKKEIKQAEKPSGLSGSANPAKSYRHILDLCRLFEAFTKENHLEKFQYMFVLASKFETSYMKLATENIRIQLDSGVVLLDEILSVRAKEINQSSPKNLFYVYTAPENLTGPANLGACFMDFLRRRYTGPAEE